jgi:hypothetical protein
MKTFTSLLEKLYICAVGTVNQFLWHVPIALRRELVTELLTRASTSSQQIASSHKRDATVSASLSRAGPELAGPRQRHVAGCDTAARRSRGPLAGRVGPTKLFALPAARGRAISTICWFRYRGDDAR